MKPYHPKRRCSGHHSLPPTPGRRHLDGDVDLEGVKVSVRVTGRSHRVLTELLVAQTGFAVEMREAPFDCRPRVECMSVALQNDGTVALRRIRVY